MKVIIAGGTGFIGQALVHHHLAAKHSCVIIGRSLAKINKIFGDSVTGITWQQMTTEGVNAIKTADLIINLTGANIGAKRWTPTRKDKILESRIIPTRTLANVCAGLGEHSPPLFNASAVGIYGTEAPAKQGLPSPIDETIATPFDNPPDFLAQIATSWELATAEAKTAGVRVVNMRFAPVLGKHGGVLSKLKIPFYFFIGGPIGSGKQPFPWIAMSDLIRAIDFVFEQTSIAGPVNFVSPGCVTQKEFAKALGKTLHRPSFVTTPAFLLKLIYGEMAKELLLSGQNAVPGVLKKQGFQFKYPEVQAALRAIF